MYASDGLCLPCSTQTTRRCCRMTLLEVNDRTSTLGHAADPRGISDGAKRVAAYHYWINTGASWYGQTRNKGMTVHVSAGCLPHARDVSGLRDANYRTGLPHGSAGSSRLESLLGDGGDGANWVAARSIAGTRLRRRIRRSSRLSAFFVRSRVTVSLINPTHCAIPCQSAHHANSQKQSAIDSLRICSIVGLLGSHTHLPAGVVLAWRTLRYSGPLHSSLHSDIVPTRCGTSCGTCKRNELPNHPSLAASFD